MLAEPGWFVFNNTVHHSSPQWANGSKKYISARGVYKLCLRRSRLLGWAKPNQNQKRNKGKHQGNASLAANETKQKQINPIPQMIYPPATKQSPVWISPQLLV